MISSSKQKKKKLQKKKNVWYNLRSRFSLFAEHIRFRFCFLAHRCCFSLSIVLVYSHNYALAHTQKHSPLFSIFRNQTKIIYWSVDTVENCTHTHKFLFSHYSSRHKSLELSYLYLYATCVCCYRRCCQWWCDFFFFHFFFFVRFVSCSSVLHCSCIRFRFLFRLKPNSLQVDLSIWCRFFQWINLKSN